MSVCCISQTLRFLPIAGLWQPTAEQIFWCHFSNPIPSLRVSVSHLDNSHHVLNLFTIVIFVCWLVTSDSLMLLLQKIMTGWRLRGRLACFRFSSVAQSCPTLRPHESQHTRPPCPSPTPRVYSNSCPLSRWCHPAISSSVIPFSSCSQSLPASGPFPTSQLFSWGGQSIGVSASASVLPMNTQDWSPLGWMVGSSCSPRDSQESSPTPHYKSINFSALSFLHSPTLTSIHDHWINHSLDQTDLCWQSNVSAF